ncbi:glucosaminidase domain-containing protein [Pelagibacteraceae bacterium]|nr:glucosaminidase domain-containing protein [Pelagibacteraceae bacterium]
MKKNISYREKLFDLASIYNVTEIKSYIKNKKNLTTAQIEHLLKKNKVPIPKEINKSILEIHSQKIKKPISNLNTTLINYFNLSYKNIIKFLYFIKKNIRNFFVSAWNLIVGFIKWINKTTINTLNKSYNFKVEEKKANKFVVRSVIAVFACLIIIAGIQVKVIYKNQELNIVKLKETKIIAPEKKVEKKEAIKKTQEKVEKKKITKVPEIEKKDPNKVTELILPNLNLKTDTVLQLFADIQYDLKKVRNKKEVKPIYFTQFPKDLDEITSVQLKKETFIKIVLPLIVAENEKILNDRSKLKSINSRKNTDDKEKAWLRQKFKEYKVLKGSVDELEKRMDIIPVSIALSQAAKESGWGTSRFALEGNAIFGQWTWNGKGIEPLDRTNNETHKILRFPILRASVKAYKNNLNTHKSYKEFREKRSSLRKKNKSIQGLDLIHKLDRYAQTGASYTKILAQIIEQNDLHDFDTVRLTNSAVKKELNL